MHSSGIIVEIAIYIAISIFNERILTVLKIMDVMNIATKTSCHRYVSTKDISAQEATNETKLLCHQSQTQTKEAASYVEGLFYGLNIDNSNKNQIKNQILSFFKHFSKF